MTSVSMEKESQIASKGKRKRYMKIEMENTKEISNMY